MPPKKKLRYDDSYLKFRFAVIKANGEEKPHVFHVALFWDLLH